MTRGSSPVLVGRGAELERLRDLVTGIRDAEHCVVLLSGEAGIGKSRLLAELKRSVQENEARHSAPGVLSVGCVEVGANLAYLPIMELLDALQDLGIDGALSAEATDLRRALGGTVLPGDAEVIGDAQAGRAAVFLRIRHLLARAASEREVVAIIDDLQWGDRSTLDVLAFLERRLVGTGVLLVLAYRSDEINRRHPLRPVLVDLERHGTLEHIRLEPLNHQEVRVQVTGILGQEPEAGRLERVVRLADGNPFHVEELLSLDEERLPPSLREVLDARLDQLDDIARRVVDQAAVIGRRVDPVLLAAVSDAPRADVLAGLRAAVDTRILVPAEDGRRYQFRHALLREAVYDDLSPIERMEAHRRIAQSLTNHPELGDSSPSVATADRARHWLAAGAEPEAFAALIEAARTATAATAWAEARIAFEDALSLWDRVIRPEAVAGSARSSILEQAAEIAWYEGDARRALVLNRRTQAEPDVIADPAWHGRLARREAWLCDDLGDLVGEGEAAQRSLELTSGLPPSIDRAGALSRMGLYKARRGQIRESLASFEEAIAAVEAVGGPPDLAAVVFMIADWVETGEVAKASEGVSRLEALLPQLGEPGPWSLVTTWTPWIWCRLGDYERAIEDADRLLVESRARGLDRSFGIWAIESRSLAEFWLGRWDDAAATIARQDDFAWRVGAVVSLRAVAAQIAAGCGDATRARSLAVEAIEISRLGFPEQAIVARAAAAWVELLDDHAEAAIGHVREAWAVTSEWEGLSLRTLVLWIGLWASAELATRSRLQGDRDALRSALEFGAELVAGLRASEEAASSIGPESGVLPGPLLVLKLAGAEASRIEGRDEAARWAQLAERFDALGDLPRTVLTRQREAEAILRDRGDRAAASTALATVVRHAEGMRADRFRDRALAVAHAARLNLPDGPRRAPAVPASRSPWALSRREREVLAMLAKGQTNRQIAEALFITDKTASVHVTHILDKLGVSRRTEAAILAVRAGIGADAVSDTPETVQSG